jgi:hypothetical protein
MMKLFLIMYLLAGPTLAGILMTVALAMRLSNSTMYVMIAAGFVIALPVAWFVAKAINNQTAGRKA